MSGSKSRTKCGVGMCHSWISHGVAMGQHWRHASKLGCGESTRSTIKMNVQIIEPG